ncbi:MAG: hypothetical protein FJX77_00225 [Armatimonadetes bacterium]|nr:hypothetical protein [Armatimonadota bacterium]
MPRKCRSAPTAGSPNSPWVADHSVAECVTAESSPAPTISWYNPSRQRTSVTAQPSDCATRVQRTRISTTGGSASASSPSWSTSWTPGSGRRRAAACSATRTCSAPPLPCHRPHKYGRRS